ITGQNLNWFWKSWFFDPSYIDLAVASVTKSGDGYTVVISNIGGMPAPVDLHLAFADGTTSIIHETPAIWAANLRQATVRVPGAKALQSLTLDGGIWMDADPSNNRWPRQ
ncbi:MAG: M1 family peptidase, partial [Gemmatimonadaceae bacterium]